jgi:hypothetical protein
MVLDGLGRVFIASMSGTAGWFRWCGILKIQLSQPNFWTESRCPTNRTAKSQF